MDQETINLIVIVVVAIFYIAVMWILFSKAEEPGVACIIPIWGQWVLIKVAGMHWIWFILSLVPGLNTLVGIVILIKLPVAFGKSVFLGVLNIVLFPIILPYLAFSDAEWDAYE